MFIFFVSPKKTNQKKRLFFESIYLQFYKTLNKRHKKRINIKLLLLSAAFYGYTDEKDKTLFYRIIAACKLNTSIFI